MVHRTDGAGDPKQEYEQQEYSDKIAVLHKKHYFTN